MRATTPLAPPCFSIPLRNTIMLARPFAVFIAVACCCFSSCATPRTSQGFIDVDGDGLGDSVVELKLAEDKEAVLLHLQKIDVCKKVQVLAEQGYARIKQLHAASRVGPLELLGSEARLASANIELIDAKLALARTGLTSVSEPTFIDTDEDGLPDMLHIPIHAVELLDEKVALSHSLFEQRSHGHERAKSLQKSGVASSDEVRNAAQQMYEAELDWLNARLERQSLRDADDR
jgi:hypothetical protein